MMNKDNSDDDVEEGASGEDEGRGQRRVIKGDDKKDKGREKGGKDKCQTRIDLT